MHKGCVGCLEGLEWTRLNSWVVFASLPNFDIEHHHTSSIRPDKRALVVEPRGPQRQDHL